VAQRTVKRQLLEPVEIALSKPTPGMWDTVLSTYAKVSSNGEESYLAKAKSEWDSSIPSELAFSGQRVSGRDNADTLPGYNCTPEENEVALGALRARTWLVLRRKLAEQTSDATVLATLRDTFEERFRYDETGVPRVWKPEDDLESAFKKAKEEVGGDVVVETEKKLEL
jgi:hypothetical protein